MNNINTHLYIQAVENVIFTQIHENKGIKLLDERDTAAMVK